MTDFIHFHVKTENQSNSEHFLAFVEGADLHNGINTLANELIRSLDWLEISAQRICLNIFTFGDPVFRTRNEGYLDACIDAEKNKVTRGRSNINYDITHIGKSFENRLSVSIKNHTLFFTAS
jgi:hypothetical protein